MTSAAAVFCCLIVVAIIDGFGSPAFSSVVLADAISATLPLIGVFVVALFAARRMPSHLRAVERVHAAVQGFLVSMAFGWWWVEPHAAMTALTGSSLAAMGWQGVFGAFVGLAFALVSERGESPMILREILLGTWVLLLLAGGRAYRVFDDVEAGRRLYAATALAATAVAIVMAAYLLLRRREKLARAVPALAPAFACALLLDFGVPGPKMPAAGDSVILVVVDTLRADIADAAFAPDREAMPELVRIAKAGVRFTQAISPAPWTLPATVSLLSGWNVHRHRFGATASDWEVTRGDPAALYFASALRERGYLTSAFVNNPYLRPYFGFDKGFYSLRPYHGRAIDGVVLALEWLREHTGMPAFTLLHIMDPHWPYDAPEGFGQPHQPCPQCESLIGSQIYPTSSDVRAELERRYAGEVRYTDSMLGRFYDTLAAGGALEHTWLVITADHGEEFWEHGAFLHGHSLYDELLRVPLVIVPPRANTAAPRGVRIPRQVRLEDVTATLLEITGVDPTLAVDGRSLVGLIGGRRDFLERPAIAGFVKAPDDLRYAVRQPPWKSIVSSKLTDNRLFQIEEDSGEQRNLLFNPWLSKERTAELSTKFAGLGMVPNKLRIKVERSRVESGASVPESDTQRALRSLGYAH